MSDAYMCDDGVEMAGDILNRWDELNDSPANYAHEMARAVIALDEEVRRLRGEVDRNLNQFICVEHGLNVRCRDGMVCATCGRDVIVVMDGKILPESLRDVVDGEIEARRGADPGRAR